MIRKGGTPTSLLFKESTPATVIQNRITRFKLQATPSCVFKPGHFRCTHFVQRSFVRSFSLFFRENTPGRESSRLNDALQSASSRPASLLAFLSPARIVPTRPPRLASRTATNRVSVTDDAILNPLLLLLFQRRAGGGGIK